MNVGLRRMIFGNLTFIEVATADRRVLFLGVRAIFDGAFVMTK